MNPTDRPNAAPGAEPPRHDEVPAPARRKLLKGGVAAPLIATIVSPPVLGATLCRTPSAAGSAGSTAHQHVACTGLSTGYWVSHPQIWPSPYVSANASTHVAGVGGTGRIVQSSTKFHSADTGFKGNFFGGKPLSEVMQLPDTGIYGLGRACATALLNTAAGRIPVLTETAVRAMWNDYITRGYYEPSAGVKWDDSKIVKYLQTTIG